MQICFCFPRRQIVTKQLMRRIQTQVPKKSELFCLFLADKKEKQSERAKEYGIGTEQLKEYERELEAIKEQLPLDENVKKIRNLYEAYEKGTKEEIKAETKSEIYGIVHKWRQEYEKYGR